MSERTLSSLADSARAQAAGLVRPEEWYRHYINPFEALGLHGVAEGAEVDDGTIRLEKKRLLHDVNLDGRAPGLGNHPLDASRAHEICGELDDPNKARYHRLVAQDRPLHQFLSRGDIEYFLGEDGTDNHAALDHLSNRDPDFLKFLSPRFSRQYT